jgi:hypothetical protein
MRSWFKVSKCGRAHRWQADLFDTGIQKLISW